MTDPNTSRPFSAAAFNQYLGEHKLMASRCSNCSALFIPPRAICPQCHRDQMEWVEASGRGRLAAFTVIYVTPNAMIAKGFSREKPYISGIVETDEGPKISARITGFDPGKPEAIRVGTPLQIEFIEEVEGQATKTSLGFKAV